MPLKVSVFIATSLDGFISRIAGIFQHEHHERAGRF